MTKVLFVITEEQLESLVADAQDVCAANIIKENVMRVPCGNPALLPKTDSHDGNQIKGLKRIYRWLNWEMANWDGHHTTMKIAFDAIGYAVKDYDPKANIEDTDTW